MIEYRIIFEEDPDPDKSWLDQPEWKGENPDDHVMVLARVESRHITVSGVGPWTSSASLGNIDCTDGPPPGGLFEMGVFGLDDDDYIDFSNAHQNEVTRDLLDEARGEARDASTDELLRQAIEGGVIIGWKFTRSAVVSSDGHIPTADRSIWSVSIPNCNNCNYDCGYEERWFNTADSEVCLRIWLLEQLLP